MTRTGRFGCAARLVPLRQLAPQGPRNRGWPRHGTGSKGLERAGPTRRVGAEACCTSTCQSQGPRSAGASVDVGRLT